MDLIGLDWIGLGWIGLDWIGIGLEDWSHGGGSRRVGVVEVVACGKFGYMRFGGGEIAC